MVIQNPEILTIIPDFRGDIITVPADKGDYRNLTQTTSAHETSPSWSPDGKPIAYFWEKLRLSGCNVEMLNLEPHLNCYAN